MNFLVKMQIESLRPVSWVLKAWVADSILIGQTLDHNFIKIDCNKIIFCWLSIVFGDATESKLDYFSLTCTGVSEFRIEIFDSVTFFFPDTEVLHSRSSQSYI